MQLSLHVAFQHHRSDSVRERDDFRFNGRPAWRSIWQVRQRTSVFLLALDQAGAYIEETQCSLADYLDLYRTRRAEVLKERGGLMGDHPDSVATTWSLSFQRVKEKNAAAAVILRFCAFLAPDAIPEEIITIFLSVIMQVAKKPTLLKRALLWLCQRTGRTASSSSFQHEAKDTFVLDEAVSVLRAYSLIRRDATEKTLSVHRLVQAVLRDAMADDETKVWAELAVNTAFPDVVFETWQQCERYLSHALVCAKEIEQWNIALLDAASLFTRVGWYLDDRARYSEAEPLLKHALATCEQMQGPRHHNTAQILNNLALLYQAQNKYELAEPLLKRVFTIYEQKLGPEHSCTATCLHNLAVIYYEQGKYEQAESLYQHALAIYEKASKPQNIARCLSCLATLYREQGKYEQAELLCQHALAICEKQLGLQHPYTAGNLNNLALLYREQGKYEQAEPLLKYALTIREQALGSEHPDTAISLSSLAILYQEQSKYEQAEPLLKRALAICEKALGPQHSRTASSLNNLAVLYDGQSKYEQSEPLYQRSLQILEQSLGAQHPHTQRTRRNYATLLRAMGRNEEAEQREEQP